MKHADTKQSFATGAQRDTQRGKGQPSLVSIYALRRLSAHLEKGAQHYGNRNWEKGLPMERTVDSLYRHLWGIIEGDASEDHFGALMFNSMVLCDHDERIKRGLLPASLNDLPNYIVPKEANDGKEGPEENHRPEDRPGYADRLLELTDPLRLAGG